MATLYGAWKETGAGLARADLVARLAALGEPRLAAELAYLEARGVVADAGGAPQLSPAGIDLWESHAGG